MPARWEGEPVHIPVMLAEVLAALRPRSGGYYVDATLGAGGHARAILEASAPDGRLLGIDRDPEAIERASRALTPFGPRVRIVHAPMSDLARVVRAVTPLPILGIVLDLGVSSPQLTDPERGFSFSADGPLDMRMDRSRGEMAADLVARLSERDLARMIRDCGEGSSARRIARAIVRRREERPLRTTRELAALVEGACPPARRRTETIHPATRTFLALRMAVNRELEEIETVLAAVPELLAPGGRVVVIAFHSGEDHIVKNWIRSEEKACICPPDLPRCACGRVPRLRALGRRPLGPSPAEVAANPRARSARLRAAERVGETSPVDEAARGGSTP